MNITIGIGNENNNKTKRTQKGNSLIDFPKDYIIFDLETTGLDPDFNEIIEIGAIKYRNMEPIEQFHSFIKPDNVIDDFITELTGITNDMVKNAPKINYVLPLFINFISDDILIGHNVNFDINFVYDEMLRYEFGYLNNNFVDTLRMSRKLLPDLRHHRLNDLAEYFDIDTNGHHRAMKDVEITNKVYIKLKELMLSMYNNIDELKKTYKSHSIKYSDIKANITDIDKDSPFFNKYVTITGTLEKMQRKEAMQVIANLGGICQDGVNKDTNYLVLGNNDYNSRLRGKKSNKLIKAENLKIKGKDIEIISENIFYDILSEYNKL